MSLEEYEHFVFRACHVEGRATRSRTGTPSRDELRRRAERWAEARELRIVGPGTDLKVGRRGPDAGSAADGRYNMPDGEVYTARSRGAEGEITFTFPAVFRGRQVDDIRLRFEAGEVVEARPRAARTSCRRWSTLDEGARRVGELAFGLNEAVRSSPATSSSTRRSAGRCTSRSARRIPSAAARTARRCTGT